jgi:hypothetical protein
MMWSTHSRRIDPISRSATPFCVTDARSELGIRTDKSFAMQSAVLTLRSRFAWAHDFDPDRSIGATFQALPGASFVVNGAAQASDSALTTASAEMKWINGCATSLTITPAAGFMIEAVLGFFLVTVVLSTAVAGRAGSVVPLAIGMTLTLQHPHGRSPHRRRLQPGARAWPDGRDRQFQGCVAVPDSSDRGRHRRCHSAHGLLIGLGSRRRSAS